MIYEQSPLICKNNQNIDINKNGKFGATEVKISGL